MRVRVSASAMALMFWYTGMVVRAGTVTPTIWQAPRSPSRWQVTIMGVAQGEGKALLSLSEELVAMYGLMPSIGPRLLFAVHGFSRKSTVRRAVDKTARSCRAVVARRRATRSDLLVVRSVTVCAPERARCASIARQVFHIERVGPNQASPWDRIHSPPAGRGPQSPTRCP